MISHTIRLFTKRTFVFQSITLNDSQKTKLLEGNSRPESINTHISPRLISGETLVYEANKVVMYRPLSDRKKETPGILTITTFRLSFVSAEDNTSENCYQQNLLLGLNDVCLSCIDTIYNTSDKTKKKLPPGNNISGKIKDLLIVCKVRATPDRITAPNSFVSVAEHEEFRVQLQTSRQGQREEHRERAAAPRVPETTHAALRLRLQVPEIA